ncbi:hypothetical protein ACLMJK_000057 [Lecanora helva]
MMINRKDTPAPFAQRAPAPRPLSLRSTVQDKSKDGPSQSQPPQTPKNKIKVKRASKLHGPTPRETYREGNARGPADDNFPDERISHDLSLTENNRHSVVDNMLMSLNPEQPKLFPTTSQDRPPFSSGSESTAPSKSPPRHLHSSSYNSDFSFPSDDSPQRFSKHLPRGRRSNSSSNFPTALQRIDSVHVEGDASDSTKAKTNLMFEGGAGPTEKPLRSGRKSGKSSGSSSVDLGHMGPLRTKFGHGRRSASFDDGDRNRVLQSASSLTASKPGTYSRSTPTFYDDLEAAPTPTVPAGPRKDRTSLFPPQPGSSAPTPQRRNSNKSAKSQAGKKKFPDEDFGDPPIPPPANTFIMGSRRASKQTAPPAFLKSRNVSPTRQHSEPVMAHRLESVAPTKESPKDKPGFFRRVFGSARNDAQAQQQSTRNTGQPSSKEGHAATQKVNKPNTPDDASRPEQEVIQPPLVKKPSSFFRRRKKSVSEHKPPPTLPPQLYAQPPKSKDSGQRSPTSSLRQVMNPYLDNPVRSDARQFAGTLGHDRAPTQTYTLQAKGSVDRVRQSHNQTQIASHSRHKRDALPKDEKSAAPTGPSLPEPKSSKPEDNSFFHDDSSNETRLPGVPNETQIARRDTVNLDQAPASISAGQVSRQENAERAARSKGGKEPAIDRSMDTSLDMPRHQDVLSARSNNIPSSPKTTPAKPNAGEWLTYPPKFPQPSPSASMKDADRVWLQPESPEQITRQEIPVPIENTEISPTSNYYSAPTSAHVLNAKDELHFPEPTAEDANHKLSVDIDPTQPNEFDRAQAKQLFAGDESLVPKPQAAAWLGEPEPARTRVRHAYMELFDWKDLNILTALRGLCAKLFLKGEAQQVDRLLDAFSSRWCTCNPNHGFKATDVVHTICYSLILLNTDLYQAGVESKMSKTQYLKNIIPTVRRVVTDAAPDAFVNPRASTLPPQRPWAEPSRASVKSPTSSETPVEPRRSFESQRPLYRLSSRPSDQSVQTSTAPHTPLDFSNSMGESGPLVKTPFHGRLSSWENQIEMILKDFYTSIRQQRLPLHGESEDLAPETPQTSSNSLSAMTSSMLRRTPSMLSKAGSENISYSRGRVNEGRLGTGRWQSKNRSRPKLYPASSVATSRRSSFDEQASMTSPSVASAWSRFSSLGKTQTSLSIDSLASSYPEGDYQHSIGFANALSQAIIREEGTGAEEQSLQAAPRLEDESLELAGAPWAKEGNLKHKHYMDAGDKQTKNKKWVDSFAVIEKGYLRLFSFNINAKSLRIKAKKEKAAGGVVGGGNWADSAESLGTFLLRQTIASALPPPGYSATRPHVWSLSLPTGAVHLFQVGTPEIAKEFVATANYWSARLSKEPMVGAISNIEYGWSESVINTAVLDGDRCGSSSAAPGSALARPSLQSSIRSGRSSVDQASVRPRLPGDKVILTEWTPPQQSLVASVLMEVDQLKALSTYVRNIEHELEKHNELRGAMLLAYSPRHPNHTKAMTNWEQKSSYLFHEVIKFKTYIDSLEAASKEKDRIFAERANARPAEDTVARELQPPIEAVN